jgi:aryl-alcohol dehydrogenase-like predicted oxidoreductase
MEYRTLGRSGCPVSVFGPGTMTFGAECLTCGRRWRRPGAPSTGSSALGKVRYWGLSNFPGWQLTKIVAWPARPGPPDLTR